MWGSILYNLAFLRSGVTLSARWPQAVAAAALSLEQEDRELKTPRTR
jgi:hypothetical protein